MCMKSIYLISFVLVLGLAVSVTKGADPNLVGWWKLDETSGSIAADSSGNANTGTLHGEPVWAIGKAGGALKLDGVDDYVDCGNKVGFDITDGITITAWVKTDDSGNYGYNPYVVNDTAVLRHFRSNDLEFLVNINGEWQRVRFPVDISFNGSWHHLVGTYDGWELRLYVDVELKAASVYEGYMRSSAISLNIGRNPTITHRFFAGVIDDVRIYNRALTEEEIKDLVTFRAGEITNGITDAEITEDPDKVIQKVSEKLQQFGDWQANLTIKAEHATEIAGALLVIAKAKEAKGSPVEEVLVDYYDITKRFPDSPQAIMALSKLAISDKKNGWQYATDFLANYSTGTKAVQFYGILIKKYMTESDYVNAEKYVKLFIDKYVSAKDSLKLVGQLIRSIGTIKNREELDKIIERNVSQNPNSEVCCGYFRYKVLKLSRAKNFDQLLELARRICAKFPGTKLSTYATAVLADTQYQLGNFAFALEALKPDLFAEHQPEHTIIKDIDNLLAYYSVNTSRPQGIDSSQVYESVAEYAHSLSRDAVAVHCYKKSARAKGFDLEVFEKAASKTTKYSNSTPDVEVWFWKGLFAAEEGDLAAAAMTYEHFIKKGDDTSILAARAYYDIARARMALGQYSEAKDAIEKAKRISPCEPIIQLERELGNSTGPLSLRRSKI